MAFLKDLKDLQQTLLGKDKDAKSKQRSPSGLHDAFFLCYHFIALLETIKIVLLTSQEGFIVGSTTIFAVVKAWNCASLIT